MRRRAWSVAVVPAVVAVACARAAREPEVIRLADRYKPEVVADRVAPSPPPPRTEWRFDAPPPAASRTANAATAGWRSLNGVAGLAVREGRLVGRSTATVPLIAIERPAGREQDPVQEVHVRMRLSGGTRVGAALSSSEKLDAKEFVAQISAFPPSFTSPAVAGDEVRSYVLKTPFNGAGTGVRHVVLQPTDVAGATFEIESVRLVFRGEHLAGVESGLGWQGLSEIYRETLVARAPESLRFDLALPARPRLDLALGTVEEGPVTFRVSAEAAGAQAVRVLERTITRPHRWEPVAVDLAPYAGKRVAVTLALAAEKRGTLGFWGTPAVRRAGARAAAGEAPPGVIVVLADTLRRDHLGAYGYARPTSPVLDRLAQEGVLFRECIGQGSWTKVATPSLMTSLYPTSHGVTDFFDRLPGSAVTLAEAYREAGYATVSFSSILFTGRFSNLHQGFEEVHEDSSLPDRNSSKTTREYVDRLLPWLEAHRDVPFFVFLHVSDPHDPYRPPPPYDALWADPAKAEQHEADLKKARGFISDPLLKAFGMPTPDELRKAGIDPDAFVAHERAWYDGSIRGMDVEIGRLVERIEALGLEDRTLLVFTSDHGEEFHEHGRSFHGQSVYGELNNVPLILWGPGRVPNGRTVERTVQTIDVMPTLLEISRLRAPAGMQGHSLWPLVRGAAAAAGVASADGVESLPAVSEKAEIKEIAGPPPRDTASDAIIVGRWKLIHNTKRPAGKPEYELYDHAADPLDARDLAAQHPAEVARLSKALQSWRRMAAAARVTSDADATATLSPAELERLKSLGYIQ
jgi:arylsulfatase A-like enzyme